MAMRCQETQLSRVKVARFTWEVRFRELLGVWASEYVLRWPLAPTQKLLNMRTSPSWNALLVCQQLNDRHHTCNIRCSFKRNHTFESRQTSKKKEPQETSIDLVAEDACTPNHLPPNPPKPNLFNCKKEANPLETPNSTHDSPPAARASSSSFLLAMSASSSSLTSSLDSGTSSGSMAGSSGISSMPSWAFRTIRSATLDPISEMTCARSKKKHASRAETLSKRSVQSATFVEQTCSTQRCEHACCEEMQCTLQCYCVCGSSGTGGYFRYVCGLADAGSLACIQKKKNMKKSILAWYQSVSD